MHCWFIGHVITVEPNVPSALHMTTSLPLHVLPSAGSQSGHCAVPTTHEPVSSSSPPLPERDFAPHAVSNKTATMIERMVPPRPSLGRVSAQIAALCESRDARDTW